jgi:hypothetical protein
MTVKAKVGILCLGDGRKFDASLSNDDISVGAGVRMVVAGTALPEVNVACEIFISRFYTLVGSPTSSLFGFGFSWSSRRWKPESVWLPDGQSDFFDAYTDLAVDFTRRFVTEVFHDTLADTLTVLDQVGRRVDPRGNRDGLTRSLLEVAGIIACQPGRQQLQRPRLHAHQRGDLASFLDVGELERDDLTALR